VVDDVAEFLGQLDDLLDERVVIVAVERMATGGAAGGLVIDDLVGRQDAPLVPGVSGLAAASLARGGLPGAGLDRGGKRVKQVRR
jgi:hypothetical protein